MVLKINTTATNNEFQQARNSAIEPKYYDMIVFCETRWNYNYQRPHHIISRLSINKKILFVEEPIKNSKISSSGNLIRINDNLDVLQPQVKSVNEIASLLHKYVKNKSIPFGWFSSPIFSSISKDIAFENIIYDCSTSPFEMDDNDELEAELMAKSKIVFASAKSTSKAKKLHHDNVHYFPSAIDLKHFAKASNGIKIAHDISHFQSPIVGYYGTIDNRIDFDLLRKVADRLPNISFVMIGPIMNIDANALPLTDNIHYLGLKPYDELPHYIKAFDIAMMPFVSNSITQQMTPKKTLEYMAAGKPIITTKINDISKDYSTCLSTVENVDEFCESIMFLLDKNDKLSLEYEYYTILKKTSWDYTTNKMNNLLKEVKKI